MKQTRFFIKCIDGAERYVFCRSGNTVDPLTKSAVITTESRERAYVCYSAEQAEKDLAFFKEHSHGAPVRCI